MRTGEREEWTDGHGWQQLREGAGAAATATAVRTPRPQSAPHSALRSGAGAAERLRHGGHSKQGVSPLHSPINGKSKLSYTCMLSGREEGERYCTAGPVSNNLAT